MSKEPVIGENWFVEYNKMVMGYSDESDRDVAVMATEFLNQCLAERLIDFFVSEQSVTNLFKGYGPLATFSARVEIAFALGFFSERMKKDLGYIRRIRNYFAHHPSVISFDVSPVKDWCRNLSLAQGIESAGGNIIKEDKPRNQFLGMILILVSNINIYIGQHEKRSIPIDTY